MSHESRGSIERAVREAFEASLPTLVDEVVRRLEGHPSAAKSPRDEDSPTSAAQADGRERRQAALKVVPRLMEAARLGGETAVRDDLQRPDVDLHALARVLDRALGERSRRWQDERLREELLREILRRSVRGDVFLEGGRDSE